MDNNVGGDGDDDGKRGDDNTIIVLGSECEIGLMCVVMVMVEVTKE